MTLKAAEAIKIALDEVAARMARPTCRKHPHTGDTWHYTFPGADGMESISPLPECGRQGSDVSALAKVVEQWAGDRSEVDSGSHPALKVPQGRMDDTAGHKVDISPWQRRGRRRRNGGGKRSTSSFWMTD